MKLEVVRQLEKTLYMIGFELWSHCFKSDASSPCQMLLTDVCLLLIHIYSYANSTDGHNFNFKPDLTLIEATPHISVKLESVWQLEKALNMLGFEPWFHCLTVRRFNTLPNVAYRCLFAFNSLLCLYKLYCWQ